MKNLIRILPALIAIVAGVLTGGWLVRFPVVHQVAGRIFQRGKLIALVGQSGIFETDLRARVREKQFCAGREDSDEAKRVALCDELIASEALPTNAVKFRDSEEALITLRHQFADDRQFRATLRGSGISQRTLRRELGDAIAGERWIENQIASQVAVSDAEVQKYFEQHQAEFMQPTRIRARHIFLAAPEGSVPELMEAKRRAMQDIVTRLGWGRISRNSPPLFPRMKPQKRAVAISVFSRPIVCRQNFSQRQKAWVLMPRLASCNRIWAFTRSR